MGFYFSLQLSGHTRIVLLCLAPLNKNLPEKLNVCKKLFLHGFYFWPLRLEGFSPQILSFMFICSPQCQLKKEKKLFENTLITTSIIMQCSLSTDAASKGLEKSFMIN